jgi:tRNA-specific 2-thiouridylase
MSKIVVAMSGGVDSSVAAYLLKEQGHNVIGLTMDLFDVPGGKGEAAGAKGSRGWKAGEDAARIAAGLKVPHVVVDLRTEFARSVVEDFCGQYALGRTPNPCVRCNEEIKFRALAERARKLGADLIATGHYARVDHDLLTGRWVLRKGVDRTKDQSYFLYSLTQDQLAGSLFPLGDLTKAEVRRIAARLGLAAADKPESQEICFIPDNDYARFVSGRCPETLAPGPILDVSGRILGTHKGIVHYTVGQRKGMGVAAKHPLYVLAIDPVNRAVVVGPNEKLYKKGLRVERLSFVSIDGLDRSRELKVRIRYRHLEAPAVVSPERGGLARVVFKEAQRAITPGQSAVFYDGDAVLGGGIIRESFD